MLFHHWMLVFVLLDQFYFFLLHFGKLFFHLLSSNLGLFFNIPLKLHAQTEQKSSKNSDNHHYDGFQRLASFLWICKIGEYLCWYFRLDKGCKRFAGMLSCLQKAFKYLSTASPEISQGNGCESQLKNGSKSTHHFEPFFEKHFA